jgi:hypothetical protein
LQPPSQIFQHSLFSGHFLPIELSMSFLTSYPGKALWVLGVVIVTLAKLPFISLYYVLHRPSPRWTVRQALMNHLMRTFLYHSAVVEASTPLNLNPGTEAERFITMPPIGNIYLKGVVDDETIRPVMTGGTWYPSPPP